MCAGKRRGCGPQPRMDRKARSGVHSQPWASGCPKRSPMCCFQGGQHPPHVLRERRCWAGPEGTHRPDIPGAYQDWGHWASLTRNDRDVFNRSHSIIKRESSPILMGENKFNLESEVVLAAKSRGTFVPCARPGPNPFPACNHPPWPHAPFLLIFLPTHLLQPLLRPKLVPF